MGSPLPRDRADAGLGVFRNGAHTPFVRIPEVFLQQGNVMELPACVPDAAAALLEPVISFCVYKAEVGHNYGDIETEGFPKRIRRQKGRVSIV